MATMNNNTNSLRVVTGMVRLSYLNVLTPAVDQSGKEKYRVTVLLPKSDVATKAKIDAAIQKAVEEAKAGLWKGFVPPQLATPIHDGDGVRMDGSPYGDECRGHWVFTASTAANPQFGRPEVIGPDLQPILSPAEIYSGMYGRVSFTVKAYEFAGKKGIAFYLGHIQKLSDGEPLSSSHSANSDFGDLPTPAPIPAPVAQQYNPAQPGFVTQQSYGQAPAQAYGQPQATQAPQYQAPAQGSYQPQPSAQTIQQYGGQVDPITGQPITPNYMGM